MTSSWYHGLMATHEVYRSKELHCISIYYDKVITQLQTTGVPITVVVSGSSRRAARHHGVVREERGGVCCIELVVVQTEVH